VSITDFISADKMTYNFGLIEYPGFDDFWEDPYLVNYITTDTNQEIKIHNYESMSYDNDFGVAKEEEYVQNMIRAPRIPQELKEAMDRMMII
jgi:predicted acetyltransferase